MKIRERIKRIYKGMLGKNAKSDIALEHLKTFLGIDGVSEDALSEATYYACLKVLGEALGKLPLKVMQYKENGGVRTAREHPLFSKLNSRPNPYMTSTSFIRAMEFNRDHYGNAFALIENAGSDMNLWILPSDQVEMFYDDRHIFSSTDDIWYVYSGTEGTHYFKSEEILHIPSSDSIDGIFGIAARNRLKNLISSGRKSQKILNSLYDNGFTAKAVLQYTSSLSEESAKAFAELVEEYMTKPLSKDGLQNVIPLPVGSSLTPLDMKFKDSQFLESRQYTALQIASCFGIKPYQIGNYEKSSYASAEAQQLSFYVDTLLYIIKQFEEEMTYKLLTNEEVENGYHIKFNVNVILRADMETQIKTLSTAVNSFIYTPNEVRSIMDMESMPGGDVLLGNGASIPVQFTGTQYIQSSNQTNDEQNE